MAEVLALTRPLRLTVSESLMIVSLQECVEVDSPLEAKGGARRKRPLRGRVQRGKKLIP